MCGLSGVISFKGINAKNKTALTKINDSLAHRGPDAGDFFFSDYVGLGHRRLSIIDISEAANQPMKSADENIILVFNGEIYNYAEIRKRLEVKYQFKTDHSDTETLIYAYKEWGIDCLEKLTGMFVFALYDRTKEEVFLVRDRIGQKPLHFCQVGNTLYFASEIHPFFKANILPKKINEEAIYHYLTFLTIDAPNTFFKDVHKLEAGHYLKINKTGIQKKQYWNIADYLNNPVESSYEEACKETEKLLEQAMIHRNIADVPITSAISGGLDSSLNLHYSQKINPAITAINISYEETSEFDESKVARQFCEELGVKFVNKVITSDDFQNLITEYLSIQTDMPIGDPNVSLMYYLSHLARHEMNAKVLLVGEGGDEIGGYPKYLQFAKSAKELSTIPNWIQKQMGNLSFDKVNKFDLFYDGEVISQSHVHGYTEAQKKRFWKGDTTLNSFKVLKGIMDEIHVDTKDKYLRKVSNLEYKLRLPEMILARIDYPSMAASIEARSPFVDHHLIEYSARLPFELRMRDNVVKSIIKEIGSDKLPEYILNHPKVGFGSLLTPFLKETLPKWFHNELLQVEAPINKYIKTTYLNKLYQKHISNKKEGYKMWILYALNKWLVIHND